MRAWIRSANESLCWAIANSAAARITCPPPQSRPKSGAARWVASLVHFGPNALVVLIPQHDRPDHKRDQRHDDRERQPSVNVAGARDKTGGDDGKETAEPAVAEVVRQRH